MAKLYNLARMTTATTGTGTITLGSAVSGCLSFADADVQDGETVSYGIIDGVNSEVGRGVYTSSGTTLTRSVLKSTNSDSTINLSGSAEVFITALAEDILLTENSIGARVYNDANISVNNTTDTYLTFNTELFDTDNIHSLVTETGRLTCQTAGTYLISATLQFATNSVGIRQAYILLNASTDIARAFVAGYSESPTRLTLSTIYQLSVGDYVRVGIYQNSGGALNVESAAHRSPEFMMYRIGGNSEAGIPSPGWVSLSQTWTYSSADDPTFVASVNADMTNTLSVGMKIKLTQTTEKYFIITAVGSYSGGATLITLYGGTDYDLANATVSDVYFSIVKAPFGFPLNPDKWTIEITDSSARSQATPVQNTWYNLGSVTISIPIGVWKVNYQVCAYTTDTTASIYLIETTFSTANNSESDISMTSVGRAWDAKGHHHTFFREKILSLSSKTSYYLNTRTTNTDLDSLGNQNDVSTLIIRAICVYL